MTDYVCDPELTQRLDEFMKDDIYGSTPALAEHMNWIMSLDLKPGDRVLVPDFPGWTWFEYKPPVN